MQNRALRDYAARRGWIVAMQVKEVGSGASQRQMREKLIKAAPPPGDRRRARMAAGPLGKSLTEALELNTPAGRAMAGLLAVFAEFERKILREPNRTGLAHARANGKRLGRLLTASLQIDQVRKLRRSGLSKSAIARQLSIGRTSVHRILNRRTQE